MSCHESITYCATNTKLHRFRVSKIQRSWLHHAPCSWLLLHVSLDNDHLSFHPHPDWTGFEQFVWHQPCTVRVHRHSPLLLHGACQFVWTMITFFHQQLFHWMGRNPVPKPASGVELIGRTDANGRWTTFGEAFSLTVVGVTKSGNKGKLCVWRSNFRFSQLS